MIKTKGQHFRHLKLDERRPSRLWDPVWPGSQLASGWQTPVKIVWSFGHRNLQKCHETKLHISLWNVVWKKKLNWIIILYRSPTHRGCFAPFLRNQVSGKTYAATRSMLSKEPWLDRDLQDYTGLDDDAEEENRFSVWGGREVVSLPDVDEGERQSAWADPLHGELCRLQPHWHIQWAWGPHPPARDPGNLKQKQRHSAVPSCANQIPLTQW